MWGLNFDFVSNLIVICRFKNVWFNLVNIKNVDINWVVDMLNFECNFVGCLIINIFV